MMHSNTLRILVIVAACGPVGNNPGEGMITGSEAASTILPGLTTSTGVTGIGATTAETSNAETDQGPDPDGDGIPVPADNCPGAPNPSQQDSDDDGMGDMCDCGDVVCDCGLGAPDVDGDGYPDACDNCPAVANADPPQDLVEFGTLISDIDEDGVGNVCDGCMHTTGVVQGNCCDPRTSIEEDYYLCKFDGGSSVRYWCQPMDEGVWFDCVFFDGLNCDITEYGGTPYCKDAPVAPAGALVPVQDLDCGKFDCASKWCVIGDDTACGVGNVCLPWHLEGEAPAELATLGACARTDAGPCFGKVGRQCMLWYKDFP